MRARHEFVRLTACSFPRLGPIDVIDLCDESAGGPAPDILPLQDQAPDGLPIVPADVPPTPYDTLSRAELIVMLQSRETDLHRLDSRVIRYQTAARLSRHRHRKFVVKLNARKPADSLVITRRGKTRLTTSAVVAVAIRRNISNISSQDCIACV